MTPTENFRDRYPFESIKPFIDGLPREDAEVLILEFEHVKLDALECYLQELARLTKDEYREKRRDSARFLGIRLSELDRFVARRRTKNWTDKR